MTVTVQPTHLESPTTERLCPLENGDRLTRAEFERRYAAMYHVKKAELIEGEVHMPSPVSFLNHAQPHARIMGWLATYETLTPGVMSGDNGTLVLDLDNEVQPDAFLLIPPEAGGRTRIGEDGFVHGPPELVVEIAASTVSIGLNRKLNVYRRSGVSEYIVWRVLDGEIDWFILREGTYARMLPDSAGLLRSEAFAGLALNPAAMISGRMKEVAAAQTEAIGAPAHAAFVRKLSDSPQP